MNDLKELHVLIPKEMHRLLFVKVSGNDLTVSQLVRKWIRQYLKGELKNE